ncbi:MAG: 16S rRNA (guanine(527)-N(7))-methyltransferase RsmG [Bacteroidales bacterium]|jgi:16S rRNA (guanine527-N7)-methyltransferase|nr:16S rRNA (guanine(527)-N(7))-methyltransferase RsmG [Bacteroidales bacterium]
MQNTPSLETCHTSLHRYFQRLNERQTEQFAMLGGLYAEWNSRINVISRRDIDNLYEHHVLHSLAIAKVIDFAPDAEVLDVGTGGGFPGIPLAILFPETHFHLIDSIGKKLKVAAAVADALKLQNVTTQQIRAEQLARKCDFVISRAVTSLPVFIPWMKGKFLERAFHPLPNGMFFLKGGDLTEELQACKEETSVWPISEFFTEPFFKEKKLVYVKN